MMAEQIVLPFRLIRKSKPARGLLTSDALVGLSYYDGASDVLVTGVAPANPNHVVVERASDGKRWTVPAGLIRLIVSPKKRRRTA
jgi:hypothetical protein